LGSHVFLLGGPGQGKMNERPIYPRTKAEWRAQYRSDYRPLPDKLLYKRNWILFCCLLVFRIFNALYIKTYFQPDEFWQSVEVANVMVYRFGYLTWEWRYGLRSIGHPLVFAAVFKLLSVLKLDTPYCRVRVTWI
jgi:hypothetical protein